MYLEQQADILTKPLARINSKQDASSLEFRRSTYPRFELELRGSIIEILYFKRKYIKNTLEMD